MRTVGQSAHKIAQDTATSVQRTAQTAAYSARHAQTEFRQAADGVRTSTTRMRDEHGRFVRDVESGGSRIQRTLHGANQTYRQTETVARDTGKAVRGHMLAFVAGGEIIGQVVSQVLFGLGRMAAGAVRTGMATAASMEQSQVAFATLLGSAQKAKDFLAGLEVFAAKTPFEMPGLVSASRQLLGVGVSAKDVIPILTAFGDASGALGLSQDQFNRILIATTQMMGKQKVSAEEMLQMTEAGLPIWSMLAKATGKPVGELQALAAKGQLLAKDVLPKLYAQMEKDYGGSMAKQSKTLSGLFSTMKDTINMGLGRALSNLTPMLGSLIPRATEIAAGAFEALGSGMKDFFDGLSGKVDKLDEKDRPAIENFGFGIRSMVLAFQNGVVTSDGFIGAMQRIGLVLRDMADWVGNVIRQWSDREGNIGRFRALVEESVRVAGDGIKDLIVVVQNLWETFKPFVGFLAGAFLLAWRGALVVVRQVNEVLKVFSDWLRQHQAEVRTITALVLGLWAAFKGYTVLKAAREALHVLAAEWADRMHAMAAQAATMSVLTMGVFAAIGAAIAVGMTVWQDHQAQVQRNREAVSELTAAIEEDTGAIGENTRAAMIKMLQDRGMFEAAKRYGVDLRDLTDAIMGDAAAMERINQATSAAKIGFGEAASGGASFRAGVQQMTVNLGDAKEAFGNMTEAGLTNNEAIKDASDQQSTYAQMLGQTNTEMRGLNDMINQMTSTTLDAARASNDYQQNLLALADTVKNNGTTALQGNTKGVLDNRDAIMNLIDQGLRNAQKAYEDSGGDVRVFDKTLRDNQAQLLASAEKAGFNRNEVLKMINQMKATPKDILTNVRLQGNVSAESWLRGYIGYMKSLPTVRYIYLKLNTQRDRWQSDIMDYRSDRGARGLIVKGPGTGTSDTAGMFALSNGEAVIPAKAVALYRPLVEGLIAAGRGMFQGGIVGLAKGAVIPRKLTSIIQQNTAQDLPPLVIRILVKMTDALDAVLAHGYAVLRSTQEYWNYAKSQFPHYGWGQNQWPSLLALWMGESGWNPYARNPSSGAYGIPQALPASKMASAGSDWATNAATQIRWGLGYIHDRYGSPNAAWSFWQSQVPHWYQGGSYSVPRTGLGYVHRGEMVIPDKFASQVRSALSRDSGGTSGGMIDAQTLRRALEGMEFRFDGDGLARLVSSKQSVSAAKGLRR